MRTERHHIEPPRIQGAGRPTSRRAAGNPRVRLPLALALALAIPAVPSAARAVERPEDYVIGVEDVLLIAMPDHPELTMTVPVRPDGKISLPLVDDVMAAGLTPEGLKESLTGAYRGFVTVPNISVVVKEINSYRVFVLGEVKNPGVFSLRSKSRVLQAIAMAGGFTAFGNRDKVLLLRDVGGKQLRMEVNLKGVYSGQDAEANVVLRPGDTVVVQ